MKRIFASALTSLLWAWPALAQAPAGQPHAPGFGEVIMKMLPMIIMVTFIYYFLVMKPQQQKIRRQEDMLRGLRGGETVVTSGGIIAKVAKVEKDFILLELGANARIKIEPAHVVKKIEKENGDKAAS